MAAKWGRRRGGAEEAALRGGKRANHPSPAYGSPAAEMLRDVGGTKRIDNRMSPAWLPGATMAAGSPAALSTVQGDAEAVNELLSSNQLAFAARFSAPPDRPESTTPPVQLPASVTSASAMHIDPAQSTAMANPAAPAVAPLVAATTSTVTAPPVLQQLTPAAQAAVTPLGMVPVPGMGTAAQPAPIVGVAGTPAGVQGPVVTAATPAAVAPVDNGTTPNKRRSNKKNHQKPGGGGRWTKEEDQKLRAAVAAVGPQNWKMIASDYLGDQRSDVQCLHRWQKVLQPGLVKGPWTKEEDQIIIDCIEAGITKWSEIAERIPGRIGKQCRERWFNHLDPSLKKGGWTEEEDAVLVEAQSKWGNSWTKIAKLLPGRSENAVKNRWNSATRRRQKAQQRTAEKLTNEAVAKVMAADQAEREAEALRLEGATAGQASSVPQAVVNAARLGIQTEEDDTECVPKSAIALLRARRQQEAQNEAQRSTSGEGVLAPLAEDGTSSGDAMDTLATMRDRTDRHVLRQSPNDKATDDANGLGGGSKSSKPRLASLGLHAPHARDARQGRSAGLNMDFTLPDTPERGFGCSPPPELFSDSSLTEREKELIRRAYRAGFAQSQMASQRESAAGKIKLKRTQAGDYEAADPVKWDFAADEVTTNSAPSGGSALPVDFLREHGIEFDLGDSVGSIDAQAMHHLTASLTAKSDTGLGDEDLELSSSLLTMSLDQDLAMDDMAMSAGTRELLGKPITSDAIAAFAGEGSAWRSHEGRLSSSLGSGRSVTPGGSGGRDAASSGSGSQGIAGARSPAAPLDAAPELGGGGFGIGLRSPNGLADKPPTISTAVPGGLPWPGSPGGSMSPTANMLHQLGDAYRDGLITDEQKQLLKRNIVLNQPSAGGASTAHQHHTQNAMAPPQAQPPALDKQTPEQLHQRQQALELQLKQLQQQLQQHQQTAEPETMEH